MKKLMIAACAVALAGAVQAASYTWQDGNYDLMVSGSEDVAVNAGISVYLFATTTGTAAQQAVLDAFLANGGIADGYISGATATTGEGGIFGPVTFSDSKDPEAGDKNWNGFYALINDDKGELYISDTKEFSVQKASTPLVPWGDNYDFASAPAMETGTYAGAGWYAAVPEPTSGLLLLLGVAGLALRRRRA